MTRTCMAALTVVVLSGCQRERAEPQSSRQVGDTTFHFSSRPARGTASLREVLRIGMLDGPPEYMLGMFPVFTVGRARNLFVADGAGLRQYDAEGRFVRTVARQGQGPGEVGYVVGMDISADGRLAVLDFRNQRVSVFSPGGALLEELRRPAGRPGYGRDAIQWDDEGRLWIALHPPRTGPDTLGARPRPLFGRLVGDGEVVDTVLLPTRAWQGCERRLPAYAGGFLEDARIPHMPFAQWTRSRSGVLAFGCSAAYAVDLVRPGGGVTRISRAWQPPMRTDEERDYYAQSLRIQSSLQPRAGSPSAPPAPALPRERPAFLRLWLADDGRLWLWPGAVGWSRPTTDEERSVAPPELNLPRRIWQYWSPTDGLDVFGPDGRWIGHVDTPETWDADPYPGIIDPLFEGDTIWAVLKEELDVRYIVKLAVEWPAAS